MVVRVRWKRTETGRRAARAAARGRAEPPRPLTRQEVEGGLAAILSPVAALLLSIALWRLGQDLGLAGNFFIREGPLSHWQPWFVMSASLGLASARLNRRSQGSGGDPAASG
jgi:hypothetical protein